MGWLLPSPLGGGRYALPIKCILFYNAVILYDTYITLVWHLYGIYSIKVS